MSICSKHKEPFCITELFIEWGLNFEIFISFYSLLVCQIARNTSRWKSMENVTSVSQMWKVMLIKSTYTIQSEIKIKSWYLKKFLLENSYLSFSKGKSCHTNLIKFFEGGHTVLIYLITCLGLEKVFCHIGR